ncbi:MAG TPA: ERF family protein [Methylomirabilota bacterium]|jgi:hypothetical protein|nr:ERF family protein [Methylomirabilota bacterium]
MTNETAPRHAAADDAALMIASAIEKGLDAEGIVKLAEVYERMEQKRAESEFAEALLAFQAECPIIIKRSEVSFPTRNGGQFQAKYARFDQIVAEVKPLLLKHGFAFAFNTQIKGKEVTSVCILTHRCGHKTETTFSAPVDPAPKISEAHATASAVTFAQRYAFQLALGIVSGLADDDGKRGFVGAISEEQRAVLQSLIDEVKPNMEQFWKYAGVQQLEDLPARDFARVHRALLDKRKGGK